MTADFALRHPLSFTWWLVGRVLCRALRLHTRGCRGRVDHSPYEGRWLS